VDEPAHFPKIEFHLRSNQMGARGKQQMTSTINIIIAEVLSFFGSFFISGMSSVITGLYAIYLLLDI
jgi:hypothetical protein